MVPLVTPILLSVSMNLTTLGAFNKWNHTLSFAIHIPACVRSAFLFKA